MSFDFTTRTTRTTRTTPRRHTPIYCERCGRRQRRPFYCHQQCGLAFCCNECEREHRRKCYFVKGSVKRVLLQLTVAFCCILMGVAVLLVFKEWEDSRSKLSSPPPITSRR